MFSSSSYKYLLLKPASLPDGEFHILTLLPGRNGCHSLALRPTRPSRHTWGNIPVKGNPEEIFQIQLEDKQKCITYNLKETLDQLRDETTLISF